MNQDIKTYIQESNKDRGNFLFFGETTSEYWLRYLTNVNMVFKVIVILVLLQYWETMTNLEKNWCGVYIVLMLMGTFWYNTYWGTKVDRANFFTRNRSHFLSKLASPVFITFGAALYYLLFGIVFNYLSSKRDDSEESANIKRSFTIISWWNFFMVPVLLAATWIAYSKTS